MKAKDKERGPTYTEAKKRLTYDPDTGVLMWIRLGRQAGTINTHGYRVIEIDGIPIRAHRLAYLLMKKRWPKAQVDHINGVKDDNRWINLRDATNTQNQRNTPLRSNNRSGFKGVFQRPENGKWRAMLRFSSKRYDLGTFATKAEAAAAYAAAARHHFGEFYRGHQ